MGDRGRRCGGGVSLSGKQVAHGVSLRGRSDLSYGSAEITSIAIAEIKTRVIDTIIIPYMSQNWRCLEENMFLLELFRSEIDEVIARAPHSDMMIYKDLISVIEVSFMQQMEITYLEKKLYACEDAAATLVVKFDAIRMKPEMELYDLILGKPDLKKGCAYEDAVLTEIAQLMKNRRANYANIRQYILHKYR
jgi:hypothetical protein